jgi:hypothetical protein
MNTFNHHAADDIFSVTAALDRYAEAGIDPAFDNDMEELERRFAELRLTQAGE